MTVNQLCFPTILFDWGNTVMLDDPASTIPMVEWQTVEVIEGIAYVLEYLHPSGRRIVLATSAAISDENQIRASSWRAADSPHTFRAFIVSKIPTYPKGKRFTATS